MSDADKHLFQGGSTMRFWFGALSAALVFLTPDIAMAQTSCSGFQSTCAARCQQRLPGDKDCVPDHCTPKLQECRKTGCWQEGRLYGGALTCNLAKR
jgi:hypothetical protein